MVYCSGAADMNRHDVKSHLCTDASLKGKKTKQSKVGVTDNPVDRVIIAISDGVTIGPAPAKNYSIRICMTSSILHVEKNTN